GQVRTLARRFLQAGHSPAGSPFLFHSGERDIMGKRHQASAAMAFPLFPKSPGKGKPAEERAKPEMSPRHDARPVGTAATTSAREVAASVKGRPPPALKLRASPAAADARERDITVTGPPSLIDWTPP